MWRPDVDAYAGRLHPARRAVQLLTLALLVAIPVSGLFRIDPVDGAFVVAGRQIWFSDAFIVLGFWIFVASLLVIFYSLAGAAFCGWMCPQNTLSEWANQITRSMLGRNARIMDMTGDDVQIALRRSGWQNKVALFLLLLAVSMVVALVPLLYFYPPSAIWSFLTFREDPRLAGSLHWIYTVCVVVVFLDVAVIRHLMCRYMCIYRIWQHSFKTRDTLRVRYDAARADDCARCHYCVDHCFVDIDPRNTEVFDSCVNCGACIAACDELHRRSRKLQGGSLLHFVIGGEKHRGIHDTLSSIATRSRAALAFTIAGGAIFFFGLTHYEPMHLAVYRSEAWQGRDLIGYRIEVANKLYAPMDVRLEVRGLKEGDYTLSARRLHFDGPGRKDVALTMNKARLSRGLHRFRVVADNGQGWHRGFTAVHYAAGG
ncbi:MAG: 4Fe-4S binding protein [Zetaproteobacteria bacterium]|nr:MAG: 4Fe-4S binding protein [Zetaproteobacteria bacterium]